ncbi:hypothetical protein GCM10023187_03600 [Nibrella viscosa]|uniref:Uncharacterized protein n=1 Tax=Nibrella viscosa TaxID=1084524 RepID=A0ABP8JTX1_9BACT
MDKKQHEGYNDPFNENTQPPSTLVSIKTEDVDVDADEVNDNSMGEEGYGEDYLERSKRERSK